MSGAEAACVFRPKVLLTYLALFRSHLILTQVCWGLHLLELQNSVQGYVLAAFFDGFGKVLMNLLVLLGKLLLTAFLPFGRQPKLIDL